MKILFWFLLLIIIFFAGVRYIERHAIYFPMKGLDATPAEAGLSFEEVYFTTSDNKRLHGWFIPNDTGRFTVIFCHGNAGNISHRIAKISILHSLGLGSFFFDYRGYGRSEGTPCEPGLYKDAFAAYDYLTGQRKIPGDNIILYGESIGAAVAIDLAQTRKVKALIAEGAFTSGKDMAGIAFPLIPHFLFSSRFDSVSKIKNLGCPKLIIHSADDEIVPFYLGKRLFDAAKAPKEFLKLRGGHNTAFLDSETAYREGIQSFL
jgi:fermentation-respiration switch protein FrsA (DUF1100 family)